MDFDIFDVISFCKFQKKILKSPIELLINVFNSKNIHFLIYYLLGFLNDVKSIVSFYYLYRIR